MKLLSVLQFSRNLDRASTQTVNLIFAQNPEFLRKTKRYLFNEIQTHLIKASEFQL